MLDDDLKTFIYDMAQLSCVVYDNNLEEDPPRFLKLARTPKLIRDAPNDVQCYEFELEQCVIIAIRGTNKITDMKLGHNYGLLPLFNDKKVKVDGGFNNQFHAIYTPIMNKIKDTKKPVVFTGHDEGAAIATIFSLVFARLGKDVNCVTFGCPKVGNKAFAKEFNEKVKCSYRIVHKLDPIPCLRRKGFYHVGKGCYISNGLLVDIPKYSMKVGCCGIIKDINFHTYESYLDNAGTKIIKSNSMKQAEINSKISLPASKEDKPTDITEHEMVELEMGGVQMEKEE